LELAVSKNVDSVLPAKAPRRFGREKTSKVGGPRRAPRVGGVFFDTRGGELGQSISRSVQAGLLCFSSQAAFGVLRHIAF
jgi:hypothetical protein